MAIVKRADYLQNLLANAGRIPRFNEGVKDEYDDNNKKTGRKVPSGKMVVFDEAEGSGMRKYGKVLGRVNIAGKQYRVEHMESLVLRPDDDGPATAEPGNDFLSSI